MNRICIRRLALSTRLAKEQGGGGETLTKVGNLKKSKILADPGKFNVPEWNRRKKMNRWRFQHIQQARNDVRDSLSVESGSVSSFIVRF